MDVSLIIKIAGVGLLVAVGCQILSRSGREEQATLLSVAGIVIVLLMLITQIGNLISSLRSIFGI